MGGIKVGAISVVDTIVQGELVPGEDGDLLFVNDTDTIYVFINSGAAYTDDNTFVLSTGDGGNTRWVGVAGKYQILDDQYLWGTHIVRGDTTQALPLHGAEVELVTNYGFATDLSGWTNGGGWAWAANDAWHTPGTAFTLSQALAPTIGATYQVTVQMGGNTAGYLDVELGGVSIGRLYVTSDLAGTIITALTTGDLIVTPSSDYDGYCRSVSVIAVTESDASIILQHQDGTDSSVEVRTGALANYGVYIGKDAGRFDTLFLNAFNTCVGHHAGQSLRKSAGNTAFGYRALYSACNEFSWSNTAIGAQTLSYLVRGTDNTALGSGAGRDLKSGSDNVFIGQNVGEGMNHGDENVFIGTDAGRFNNNVGGSGNVFIGYRAGSLGNYDNKLIIENSLDPYTPLILGDFDENWLDFNGNTTDITTSFFVNNDSGGTINQYTIFSVGAAGYNPGAGRECISIEALSSYTDIPLGILVEDLLDTNRGKALKRGALEVTGFDTTGSSVGAPVFTDNSGALTLVHTPLQIGIVLTLNANGVIYFDPNVVKEIGWFATVAAAEAASGYDNSLCYVLETETFYRYEATASTFVDDNTYVLSTAEAGDTRWLAVGGKYNVNGNVLTVDTVASAEAMNGQDTWLIYVVETETIYRYEATASTYTDDNTFVLSTGDGGNTRWLSISGKYSIYSAALGTNEPSGFPIDDTTGLVNTTDSALSWNGGTRTLSLNASGTVFDVYIKGIRTTLTNQSTIIAATEGLHYIYLDSSGVLTSTTTWSDRFIYDGILVAVIYWDTTNVTALYYGDARCGLKMDGTTHYYFHNTRRSLWVSDNNLDTINADNTGSSSTHAQFGVGAGFFLFHDRSINTAPVNTLTGCRVYYRDGSSGNWRTAINPGYSVLTTGTGRAAYNQWTGAAWQLTEVTDGYFMHVHVFATNNSVAPKNIAIMGQSQYSTLAEARENVGADLRYVVNGGIPFYVNQPIATVIFQTDDTYANAVKSRIRSYSPTADYKDWRYSGTTNAIRSFVDHSDLTGNNADAHGSVYPAKEGRSNDIENNATTGTINNLVNVKYTGTVFSGAGAVTLTGLVAAEDGKKYSIFNDTGESLILSNENALSLAANRILTGSGGNISILDGRAVQLEYEEVNGRWRLIGRSGGIQTFDTVIEAEAQSGSDNDLCCVVETDTIYRYESTGSVYTDDNTFVLSTGDGGNTRWVGIAGQYGTYDIFMRVFSVANAAALQNVSQNDLLFVVDTKTIYRYEAVGGAYTVDNTYVLDTIDGGNTRWIGFAGQYKVDSQYILGSLTVTSDVNMETINIEVYNNTGGALAQYKVVVADGVDGTRPSVDVMSATSQKPLGILTAALADTAAGYVRRQGVLQVTGFDTTLASVGDAVYADNSGDLTLAQTAAEVGIVLTLNANGTIYLNVGGAGSSAPGAPTGDPLRVRLAAMEIDGTTNAIDTDRSLYQVAALSSAIKCFVKITNRNNAVVNVRLAHVDGAIGSVTDDDYILYDTPFQPYETKTIEIPGMAASDSILVRSDTVDVNFRLDGYFTATTESLKRIAAYDVVAADTNEQVVNLTSNTANFVYYICNKSSSASCTVRVAMIDGALGALADEDYALYEEVLTPNETKGYVLGEGLASGGTVMIRSSRTDTNLVLYGETY